MLNPKTSLWARFGDARRYIMIATVILTLMTITVLVGRQENTVADIVASFIATTITFATPLTLGALSGIYCERAGVVNIAIEGMMLGACFFGFIGASWFKSQGLPDQAALMAGRGGGHVHRPPVCRAARRAVHPLQGESDHQRHGD